MTDRELEGRLRRMLADRADQVGTQLTGASLRTEKAAQQIDPAMRDCGERTGSGGSRPRYRKDRIMTEKDLAHRASDDEIALVDAVPLHSRRRRAAIVSGGALAAAAAAVIAVVMAPTHHLAGGGTPAAAGDRATHPATVRTTLGTAAGPYTYVHATFGDGTTSYQDVWIPADPTTGVWQLNRKDDQGTVSQRATCARFPLFQLATVTKKRPDGSVEVVTKGGLPGCDAGTAWAPYRPPFADALPTDPHALLAFLRNHGGKTDAEAFETGSDFLASGWVPKAIASNVLAALKLIPGVVEKHDVPNGAGVTGTALTYTGRIKATVPETWGVIVSSTGDVIGSTFSYSGHPTETDGITRTTVDAIGETK